MSKIRITPPVTSSVVTQTVPAAFGHALCVKLPGVCELLSTGCGNELVSEIRRSPL